jgi:hypothetical protein
MYLRGKEGGRKGERGEEERGGRREDRLRITLDHYKT